MNRLSKDLFQMSQPEETESLGDMVEAYIRVLESTMEIKKTSRKNPLCCHGRHKTWFMHSDGWEPRSWRKQYSGHTPEEFWIEEHGTGELWIVTVGDKPKGGVRENYKKFLSILKPERIESGYSRMRGDQFPSPKGGERWGKILTNNNYVETLSHYIHAMKLG